MIFIILGTPHRFKNRIRQHVPSTIRSHNQTLPSNQNSDSAITQYWLANLNYVKSYKIRMFSCLDCASTSFQLAILKALWITLPKPCLYKQKEFRPVSWGFRIYRLHLCRRIKLSTISLRYDTKLFDGDPLIVELWGMWSTPSLLLLPVPLWSKMLPVNPLYGLMLDWIVSITYQYL